MNDCIFCKIGRGEIPAKVVWENDGLLAFDDIAPQAPVHTLVIPREHFSALDGAPEALLGRLMAAVPAVARIKGVAQSGYRTIINTGADAGQTVPHLHVHILGGCAMSEGMVLLACDS